jgi:hypothetical protein
MKKQFDSEKITIYRNTSLEEQLKNFVTKAYERNEALFGKLQKKVRIFICDSEEEYKQNAKYFYFPHSAGTCLKSGKVVVRSQESILEKFKINMWGKYYEDFLAHEINHSFWWQLYKTQSPVWLHEAIANIIQGRIHYNFEGDFLNQEDSKKLAKEKRLDSSCLKFRYFERDFNSPEKIRYFYSVWGHFAEFISNNKPHKLVRFMTDFSKNPSKKNYETLSTKYFGNLAKKFEEFKRK